MLYQTKTMIRHQKLLSIFLVTTTILIAFFYMSCLKPLSEEHVDTTAGFNGGFEHIHKGLPVNWMLYTTKTVSEGKFSLSIDTLTKKEGKQSLRFQVEECSARGGHLSPGIAKEIAANAGDTYTLKMWVKNSNAFYRITLSGVNAKHIADLKEVESSESTSDWKLIEMEYTLPERMNALRLEFNILKPGECWVDEISFLKK